MVRLRNILTLIEQEANEPSHFGGGKNLEIYNYNTEHFDICKSAVMLFEKIMEIPNNQAKDHTVHAAKYIDELFGIEKDVVKANSTNPEQLDKALELASMFSYEIGIVSDVKSPNVSEALPAAKSTVVQSSSANSGLPFVSDTINSSIHKSVFPVPFSE